ncbi:uncharacterized protein [Macaca nemestrina]|uniref:uncharacterized protein isoform X1 n=1 Tax=Macaca nemestrina TaxID=9545 RepID=UPI0039B9064E
MSSWSFDSVECPNWDAVLSPGPRVLLGEQKAREVPPWDQSSGGLRPGQEERAAPWTNAWLGTSPGAGADTRPPSPLQTAADPGGEKSPERQIPAGLFTQRGGGGQAGYWGPTDWEPQLRLGQPQLCSLRTAHKHPSAPPHPRCTPVRVSPPLHTLFTNISIRLSKSFTPFHTRGCDTTHKCFHTSAPSHVFHVWLQFKSPFMPRFSQSIFKSPFARCTRVLSHILRSSVPFNVSKIRTDPSRAQGPACRSCAQALMGWTEAPLAPAAHVTHSITHSVALYSRHLGDDTISRTKTTLTNPTKTNSRMCVGRGSRAQSPGRGWGRRRGWERGRPSLGMSTTSHPARSARGAAKPGPVPPRSQTRTCEFFPSPARDCAQGRKPTTRTGLQSSTQTHK